MKEDKRRYKCVVCRKTIRKNKILVKVKAGNTQQYDACICFGCWNKK